MAEAGNLKLDLMAKKHWNLLFWFEYIFRCYRDTKTTKTSLAVYTLTGFERALYYCFKSDSYLDINECHVNSLSQEHVDNYSHNCHVDANCTNTKGSFYCTCHTGYSGDGVTCIGTKYVLTITYKVMITVSSYENEDA